MLLCLWHVQKTCVKNAIKKIASIEERAKVLCALGRIMYLKGSPTNSDLIIRRKTCIFGWSLRLIFSCKRHL
jgi:hypothetical protein